MPRYVSVKGETYGVWCEADGTKKDDAVPAAKKTADILVKISASQNEHVAQAKKK